MVPDTAQLTALIRDIPDVPEPGIVFKDITPLLADGPGFRAAVDALVAPFADETIDVVVGMEARGFLFAAPIAYRLGAGCIPLRKPGKLPYDTVSHTYELEYGTDSLEAHVDAVTPGARVLIVDDVLATGGTAAAAVDLVTGLGGVVVGCSFLIELAFLDGRSRLASQRISSTIVVD